MSSIKTILKWLRSWSTRSLGLVLMLLVLSGTLMGCSNLPLKALLGSGGPNVAANTQIGKTNTQTIGTTTVNEQKLVRPQARTINQTADKTSVKTDQVDSIVVNEVPIWIILLLVLGWLLPSPNEMGRQVRGLFKKHD